MFPVCSGGISSLCLFSCPYRSRPKCVSFDFLGVMSLLLCFLCIFFLQLGYILDRFIIFFQCSLHYYYEIITNDRILKAILESKTFLILFQNVPIFINASQCPDLLEQSS